MNKWSVASCCTTCARMGGRHEPLSRAAVEIASMWEMARRTQPVAGRVAMLELPMLAAQEGTLAAAADVVTDVLRSEGVADSAASVARYATRLAALSGNDVRSLHLAWDEVASCPVGAGPPAVGVIRSDLPLQRGFRLLPHRARLVFLTLAAEAGHRAIRADAQSLMLRTQLDVPTVYLALRHLVDARWLSPAPDLGVNVVTVTRLAFPALSAARWGFALRDDSAGAWERRRRIVRAPLSVP